MTRSGHSRIALLTRLPEPGRVKTRLIARLGPAGAADLHRQLTEHVALEVLALRATGEAEVEVWHDGGARAMRRWLGRLPRYLPQPDGDLGARLRAVMLRAFGQGAERALVIGSDCPAMTADHLRQALDALEDADLVLGPALDGGYWLLGLRGTASARATGLFEGVSWGSAAVLRETLERAASAGLVVAQLEALADIDRPEDLPEWERRRDPVAPDLRVSVVIPTVDEHDHIAAAVSSALQGGASEVIVADGDSIDGTREVAARAGAIVIEAPRGRARQLNAGAARAGGEALVFLHADSRLPAAFSSTVREALCRPRTVAGAFSYRATATGPLGLLLTHGGRLRCRLSGHPYGDQALFLRHRTFRALGGFPELPVMEDWELVTRLRRLGKVVVLSDEVVTSSASFVDHGLLRAGLINLGVVAAYQLGADPARLAAWRSRIARRPG